jgi:tRNA pseudouridine13 synthase
VNEVDLDSQVVCVKSLAMPESVTKDKLKRKTISASGLSAGESMVVDIPAHTESSTVSADPRSTQNKDLDATTSTNELAMPDAIYAEATTESLAAEGPWSDHYNDSLRPYLSEDAIAQLRKMVLEGPEPPVVDDPGQSDRPVQSTEVLDRDLVAPPTPSPGNQALTERGQPASRSVADKGSGKRGHGKGRRRHARSQPEDERRVFSEVRIYFSQFSPILSLIIYSPLPARTREPYCMK